MQLIILHHPDEFGSQLNNCKTDSYLFLHLQHNEKG